VCGGKSAGLVCFDYERFGQEERGGGGASPPMLAAGLDLPVFCRRNILRVACPMEFCVEGAATRRLDGGTGRKKNIAINGVAELGR